jgi:putative transposase
MGALDELAPDIGLAPACLALAVNRSGVYREDARRRPLARVSPPPAPRPRAPLALSESERRELLEVLDSERLADCAPRTIYALLLDEGRYLGSASTLYRLLASAGQSCERRNQRVHRAYARPRVAGRAAQRALELGHRQVEGPAEVALFLPLRHPGHLQPLCRGRDDRPAREGPSCRTVDRRNRGQTPHRPRHTHPARRPRLQHARAKSVAALLVDLEIAKTHSRPYVSDDNPFSEAQFKTLKYRPAFPERFGCIEDARAHSQHFFAWYNGSHCHSGIGFMTPQCVHYGQANAVFAQRAQTLHAAFLANPIRFKRNAPQPPRLPIAVWINPPKQETAPTPTPERSTLN